MACKSQLFSSLPTNHLLARLHLMMEDYMVRIGQMEDLCPTDLQQSGTKLIIIP
jgi:hypothetical protein